MPHDASSLGDTAFVRALVMGNPKVGKTTTCIKTAVSSLGGGYVICCSTREHLRSAQLECPTGWEFDVVKNTDDMEAAIRTARQGVKEGRYKWVILDDFNLYAMALEEQYVAGCKTKYEAYQRLRQVLMNNVYRLCDLKAHLICTVHYYEVGDGEIEGQLTKKGKGIVPLMPGQSRQLVPAAFNQVIWMQANKDGSRVFCLNPEGVWGVGSQGLKLPAGTKEIPADLGLLARALEGAK